MVYYTYEIKDITRNVKGYLTAVFLIVHSFWKYGRIFGYGTLQLKCVVYSIKCNKIPFYV